MSGEQVHGPNQLTAVVFKEDDQWVAMFVEKYIGAQGRNEEEAIKRLQVVYRAELDESIRRTGEAFGGIMESPEEYGERLANDPFACKVFI